MFWKSNASVEIWSSAIVIYSRVVFFPRHESPTWRRSRLRILYFPLHRTRTAMRSLYRCKAVSAHLRFYEYEYTPGPDWCDRRVLCSFSPKKLKISKFLTFVDTYEYFPLSYELDYELHASCMKKKTANFSCKMYTLYSHSPGRWARRNIFRL